MKIFEGLDIKINNNNIYKCCDFNVELESCKSDHNYIKVQFKLEGSEIIEYKEGFGNQREGIELILKGETIIYPNEELTIKGNEEIEIYFVKNITSLENMFNSSIDNNVSYIISIDFPNFDGSVLTNMNSLFKGCTGLKAIDFSGLNASSVTDMSYLFYDCISLTSVDLSNFKTERVINMEWMFYNCQSLKSIDLSNFNTESLTNMNSMFSNCFNVSSVSLSNFNTEGVTDMNSMFLNCFSLTYLDLFNFNTSIVSNMSSMFENSFNLQILKLNNFETYSVIDMSKMFYSCSSLIFLDISHFNMQNVNKSDEMFYNVGKFLKYLNLYNIENSKGIITNSPLNELHSLKVCQKDQLITEQTTINYCCYFNVETKMCEDSTANLFRIVFASDVEYPNGFGSEYRKNINFIIAKGHNDKISQSKNISFIAGIIYEIQIHHQS